MKYGLFMILAFFGMQTFAQSVQVELGDPLDNNTTIYDIIGQDEDDNTYVFAGRRSAYYLEKYAGSSMTQTLSKEIILPEINNKKQDFELLAKLKDRFVIFSSFYDKKADKFYINSYEMSLSGVMDQTEHRISEIDAETRRQLKDLTVKVSGDGSKFLVSTMTKEKKQNPVLTATIYNEEFERVNQITETFKLKDAKLSLGYELTDIYVGNDGSFYFGLFSWETSSHFSSEKENSKFDVISVDKAGIKDVIPMKLGKLTIGQISFTIDNENNYHAIGYYMEEQKKGVKRDWVQGVFYLKIDGKTKQKSVEKKYPFSDEFLKNFTSDKKVKKGVGIPNYYIPRKLIMTEDGSFHFVTEYYLYTEYTRQTKTGSTTTYTWRFGSVIVTKINANGEMEWNTIVPKYQYYSYTSGLSIAIGSGFFRSLNSSRGMLPFFSILATGYENEIYLFFNDNIKNLNYAETNKLKAFTKLKKSAPFIVKIDSKGESTKEIVTDLLTENVYVRPRTSQRVGKGKFVIYATLRKQEKLGVLTIN